MQERIVNVIPPLITDGEPAVLREPRQSPFHYPSVSSQLLRTLHLLPGYAPLDAAPLERPRALLVVVGLVGVQLLGALPRSAPRALYVGSMESKSSSKTIESLTFAALAITASGMPPRSTTTWRFVPGFPLSPSDSGRFFGPFFGRDARRVQRGALPVYPVGLSEPVEQRPV